MSDQDNSRHMEFGGTLNYAVCSECGHPFKDSDEFLITSALGKIVNGKLMLDDHAPSIICFPGDSDGHYTDRNS